MRMITLVVAVLVLVGCTANDRVGVTTATADASPTGTAAATPEQTPEPTATEEPTASPAPTPEARAPEIAAFNVVATDYSKTLMVRLHNPNEGVGLIRAGFELTALGGDGSIIDVYGTEGLPGASCCTIYRLPPGGDFGLALMMDPGAPDVSGLELAVTARWTDWAGVEAPDSELSNLSVVATDFSGPQLTGRVTTPQAATDGPFNVWITGFVDSPDGMIVLSGSVDCVATADARAFAIDSFLGGMQGPYTLESAVAYTTTVPGETEPAPGC